ncbi:MULTISPECIES: DUF493 family protein [Galbibacter]|uniref:DUF493 family protein n=1 Tax=Galbibacter pacificus TaxID=2996052 RepID=A0ABT6FUQ2_9FLAO|nr:DUF493 family protein [Galbibacter pacificus]MDG3583521.1 DUF493 family protein [Galbibacter pacificus]MDG3587003.1 DUF493 family protein [Galbibacter pacificus]
MKDKKEVEEFYARLKNELDNTTEWPSQYLYKFIVPTDQEKIKQIETIFDNTGAVISTKTSSNGKYTSLSVEVKMKDSDAVIEKYKEVSTVEGVISL